MWWYYCGPPNGYVDNSGFAFFIISRITLYSRFLYDTLLICSYFVNIIRFFLVKIDLHHSAVKYLRVPLYSNACNATYITLNAYNQQKYYQENEIEVAPKYIGITNSVTKLALQNQLQICNEMIGCLIFSHLSVLVNYNF